MKITYTPNPLETKVELEDHEKELLRLKIKIEIYEDMLFDAHYVLKHSIHDRGPLKAVTLDEAVAEAIKQLNPDKWCTDETSPVDAHVEKLLRHYLEELKSSHHGDCTSFPASCSKCLAEEKLGINTLGAYPGKSILHSIFVAFNYRDGEELKQRDMAGALEWLLTNGRTEAHAWLLNYRNTHFPE
jgi:hypothetical protein